MNTNFTPDLKKLITAFLALAIVASSSALALSTFTIGRSSPPPETEAAAPFPENVFVEQLPNVSSTAPEEAREFSLPPITPTTNMTDTMVQTIARQIIAANPNGPQLFGGNRGLAALDDAALEALIAQNVASAELPDLAASADESRIKTLTQFGAPEVDNYINSATNILAKTTASPEFKLLARTEPSMEAVNAGELVFQAAEEKLYELSVPLPLLPFHKNLIAYLAHQRDVLSAIANYERDPIKMLLVARLDEEIGVPAETFADELQNLRFVPPTTSRAEDFNARSLFARTLGIASARAQALDEDDLKDFMKDALQEAFEQVGDLERQQEEEAAEDDAAGDASTASQNSVPITLVATTDQKTLDYQSKETKATTSDWKQSLLRWARTLGTAILKNVVVRKVVEQIIGWVQGRSQPQFVTDWKSFLSDAFNEAAGVTLQKIYPDLCYSFSPVVRAYLQPIVAPSRSPVTCTLDRIVGNIEEFHDDFTKGGWVAFGASAHPSNNVFGAIFEAQGVLADAGEKAREAADAQAKSGQGFLPTQRCIREVPEQKQVIYRPYGGSYVNTVPAHCEEWEDTTPGKSVADITSKALGSSLEEVINADDLEALISAAVDAFLNYMIDSGAKGLLGTSKKNRRSNQPSGRTPAGTDICDELTGKARRSCERTMGIEEPTPKTPTSTPTSTTQTP